MRHVLLHLCFAARFYLYIETLYKSVVCGSYHNRGRSETRICTAPRPSSDRVPGGGGPSQLCRSCPADWEGGAGDTTNTNRVFVARPARALGSPCPYPPHGVSVTCWPRATHRRAIRGQILAVRHDLGRLVTGPGSRKAFSGTGTPRRCRDQRSNKQNAIFHATSGARRGTKPERLRAPIAGTGT